MSVLTCSNHNHKGLSLTFSVTVGMMATSTGLARNARQEIGSRSKASQWLHCCDECQLLRPWTCKLVYSPPTARWMSGLFPPTAIRKIRLRRA